MAHRSRFDGTHQPGPGLAFVRADKCGEDRAAGAPRDAIYYLQLARQARRLAAEHTDPDVARRLPLIFPVHPRTRQSRKKITVLYITAINGKATDIRMF